MNDIKRKVELWLCERLTAAVPSEKFYPAKGGTDTADSAAIVPPFTVVEATEAERAMPNEPTYAVTVSLTRYSHFADTQTPQHSAKVRAIVDAVVQLPAEWFDEQLLRVHGSYFSGQHSGQAGEGDESAYVDQIELVVGCSG